MTDDPNQIPADEAEHPSGASPAPAPAKRSRRLAGCLIAFLIVALIVGGLVALVVWSRSRASSRTATSTAQTANAREAAWRSAMEKAGVDATYPAEPVALDALKPTGREPFSATFTAEELDALLATYPYAPDDPALAGAEVEDLAFEFPRADRTSVLGHLVVDGTRYEVAAAADVRYEDGRVVIAEQGSELRVEGFGVGGAQKSQALTALGAYVNSLLATAPGLEITDAEITADGVVVSGFAPTRLENP